MDEILEDDSDVFYDIYPQDHALVGDKRKLVNTDEYDTEGEKFYSCSVVISLYSSFDLGFLLGEPNNVTECISKIVTAIEKTRIMCYHTIRIRDYIMMRDKTLHETLRQYDNIMYIYYPPDSDNIYRCVHRVLHNYRVSNMDIGYYESEYSKVAIWRQQLLDVLRKIYMLCCDSFIGLLLKVAGGASTITCSIAELSVLIGMLYKKVNPGDEIISQLTQIADGEFGDVNIPFNVYIDANFKCICGGIYMYSLRDDTPFFGSESDYISTLSEIESIFVETVKLDIKNYTELINRLCLCFGKSMIYISCYLM